MPKIPSFKISEVPGKKLPHVVEVPASISETGKRLRKAFKTSGEAKGYVAALKRKASLQVEQEVLLPTHIRKQAVAAHQFLRSSDLNVTLLDAVKGFAEARAILGGIGETDILEALRHHVETGLQRKESPTFLELIERFISAPTKKRGTEKDPKYVAQISRVRDLLGPHIGHRPVCDLDGEMIEKTVSMAGVSPGSVDATYRVLRAVFNHAKKRAWIGENPVDRIDWFQNQIEEARVPTLAQAEALLLCSKGKLQAYVALCLFSGLRDSEARRLRWEDIRWEEKEIYLPPASGRKESTGRFIRFEDNLAAWLRPFAGKGLVCGLGEAAIGSGMRRLRPQADKMLGELKRKGEATLEHGWQRDLMRHGAASYWGALHGIAKASAWLGHGEDVHRQHYRRPVAKAEAEAFFGIAPKGAGEKIIELRAS